MLNYKVLYLDRFSPFGIRYFGVFIRAKNFSSALRQFKKFNKNILDCDILSIVVINKEIK